MNFKNIKINEAYEHYPVPDSEEQWEAGVECINAVESNSKNAFKILQRRIKKYPRALIFRELLMDWSFNNDKSQDGIKYGLYVWQKDPLNVNVYNRVARAYLELGDVQGYSEFTGLEEDLQAKFPDREEFHPVEIVEFAEHHLIFALREAEDFERAKSIHEAVFEVVESEELRYPLIRELVQYQMFMHEDDSDEIETEPSPLPEFRSNSTRLLYEIDDPAFVDGVLTRVRAIPEEDFLHDMGLLIDEFAEDYSAVTSRGQIEEFALLAACFMLADRKIGFDLLLKVLAIDEENLDDYVGDYLTEIFWMIVYDCEHDDLEKCLEFVKRADVGEYSQQPILKALKVKASQHVERREEIIQLFHALLDYLIDNKGEVSYSEDYYRMVCEEAGELDMQEFEEKIKFFFENELYPPYEYESFEEFKQGLIQYFQPELHQLLSTEARFAFFVSHAGLETNEEDYDFDESFLQNFNSFDETESKEPSRNDPCPCGSGKKYKKCCMNA